MRRLKRMLAVLTALIILLEMFPFGVFAQLTEQKTTNSGNNINNQTVKTQSSSYPVGYFNGRLELGSAHGAFIDNNHVLWTWGFNNGLLGAKPSTYETLPIKVTENAKQISISQSFMALVKQDGTLWTWGWNSYGQLAQGSTDDIDVPTQVKNFSDVKQVSAGAKHILILKNNGSLYACGDNLSGRLGNGTEKDSLTPVFIMDNVQTLPANMNSTSAAIKKDGTLWTWGDNGWGTLGDESNTSKSKPTQILKGLKFKQVDFGNMFAAALTDEGALYTWGYNGDGNLGRGLNSNQLHHTSEPKKILENVDQISLGANHGAAIKNNTLWSWGANYKGQVGNLTNKNQYSPVQIMSGVSQVALGTDFSSAIKTDGSFWMWGDHYDGLIGKTKYELGTPTKIDPSLLPWMTSQDNPDVPPDKPDQPSDEPDQPSLVPVTGIHFDSEEYTINLDQAGPVHFKPVIEPANATNQNLEWSSSDTSVADVNGGVIIAHKVGSTIITAKTLDGGFRASYRLTVKKTTTPDNDLSNLSYSFSNDANGFGYPAGYRIPLSSYQIMFEDIKAKFLYDQSGAWGGNCFGMCTTSALFNDDSYLIQTKDFNTSADKVSKLKLDNYSTKQGLNLKQFIEALQVSQQYESRQYNLNYHKSINEVFNLASKGQLVIVDMFGPTINEEGEEVISGHSVLAYKIVPNNETEYKLYVYDPNSPNQVRYITLWKDNGDFNRWYYKANGEYNWGSDYENCSISYFTEGDCRHLWRDKFEKNIEKNTLVVNRNDFDVANSSGNIMASVRKGVVTNSNNDVSQIILTGITADGKTETNKVMLKLPCDVYKIKRVDSSKENMEVGMINEDQSLILTTTADSATVAVNDSKNLNTVTIPTSANDTYSSEFNSSLTSAKGKENIKISGTGNGKEITIGTSNGNYILENAEKAKVVTNGKEDTPSTSQNYVITGSVSPKEAGTISGSGTYKEGETATLKATTNNGYKFVNWTENGKSVSTSATYSFKVSANRTLTANFEKISSDIPTNPETTKAVPVYRIYHEGHKEHLYTTDSNEVRVLTSTAGWKSEGVGWNSPNSGTPVYRLYSPATRYHLYTTDTNEVKVLSTQRGWQVDYNSKPLFYSGGSTPIYRLYHEGQRVHHLTKDSNEYSVLGRSGWNQEGIKFYALSDNETNNPGQPSTPDTPAQPDTPSQPDTPEKPEKIAVTGVSISASTLSLKVGESQKLIATVLPENATDKSVIWNSSDSGVATVLNDGTVTAKKSGNTLITVKTIDGGKTAACAVTVREEEIKVERIELTPSNRKAKIGDTFTISADINPQDATNKSLNWSSSNNSVAKVGSNGYVECLASGEAIIYARATDGSGRVGQCSVVVETNTIPVTGVSLSPSTKNLYLNDETQLTAVVEPSNATNKELTWSSSNGSIARVDQNGRVQAIAVGKATITVKTKDGNFSASCEVTVANRTVDVTGISLSQTSLEIFVGGQASLKATVSPENATNKKVLWKSGNSEIASVTDTGVIKGLKGGSTKIIATTEDGNYEAECSVTVVEGNGDYSDPNYEFSGTIKYSTETGDIRVSTDNTNYVAMPGTTLNIMGTFVTPENYQSGSRKYVGYLAFLHNGQWEEISNFNLDGGTAEADMKIKINSWPKGTYTFTLSIFPGDNFTTGNALENHLFRVTIR